jgi:hypothetical protein
MPTCERYAKRERSPNHNPAGLLRRSAGERLGGNARLTSARQATRSSLNLGFGASP